MIIGETNTTSVLGYLTTNNQSMERQIQLGHAYWMSDCQPITVSMHMWISQAPWELEDNQKTEYAVKKLDGCWCALYLGRKFKTQMWLLLGLYSAQTNVLMWVIGCSCFCEDKTECRSCSITWVQSLLHGSYCETVSHVCCVYLGCLSFLLVWYVLLWNASRTWYVHVCCVRLFYLSFLLIWCVPQQNTW